MLKSSGSPSPSCIRLRGVRHNNLKNFDLDLPLKKLIVVTGLSGSGKSSLAFDTLFAEGQRRYIETFSPYARQFLDRMDKPQVDAILEIPPAIAIEQRNAVKTTRSTVGTMTEINDHMKLLWPQISTLHCRNCHQPVRKEPPSEIWRKVSADPDLKGQEVLVTFDVPLSGNLSLQESLGLVSKQGYQRLLQDGKVVRLADYPADSKAASLTVIQDRVRILTENRSRFTEACEQAYHFGKCKLALYPLKISGAEPSGEPLRFSGRLHCAQCDIEYRDPTPALFSYNHPVGACPACRGFGRIISIDYNLAIPDRSRTLRQGVVKPWLTGQGAECHADMLRTCRENDIPLDVPYEDLPRKWQSWILDGQPDYGKDEAHEWPNAWYGVKGYFRWLESKAYKMHVRVLLSRYRAYTPCPACHGSRFQPETMLYLLQLPENLRLRNGPRKMTLSDFYQLPIRDALAVIDHLGTTRRSSDPHDPLSIVLPEIRSRLGFLDQVGLGYLTLDRPTRTLSGGETERVNLTSCLGTRLVNTLFVLDEPSVGLHPRDTERLVRILQQLRDAGNTVVVVEHEASVMRAADQIVDLGPGHGATGGSVVFQGSYPEILQSESSLTGKYLSGRVSAEVARRRAIGQPIPRKEQAGASNGGRRAVIDALREKIAGYTTTKAPARLRLSNVTKHNLKDLSVDIPLNAFVCVTGLSGSGKTTLMREVLMPLLQEKLKTKAAVPRTAAADPDDSTAADGDSTNEAEESEAAIVSANVEGVESLGKVVLVDQSSLGKTPRSNPAVYIGAFDHIRDFFAASEAARRKGLNASAFSFNSGQGQCERCRGAGFEKIEMQFLSDVYIKCPDCNGRRYRPHILAIKVSPAAAETKPLTKGERSRGMSIADCLDATVDEAVEFFSSFPESKPAQRAMQSLQWLVEVGLGYLKLGQPINTLSGGESQRLKLVSHLAEMRFPTDKEGEEEYNQVLRMLIKPSLFLFDEPTTGLHFDDVRVLLGVFQRLVDAGHSVLVIEHNIDVIKSADWIIDLGPGAGDDGGRIVAEGTPEDVARVEISETGKVLRKLNSDELEENSRPRSRAASGFHSNRRQ